MISTQKIAELVREFSTNNGIEKSWTAIEFDSFIEEMSARFGELPQTSLIWIEVRRAGYFIPDGAMGLRCPDAGTVRDALMRDGIIRTPKRGVEEHFKRNNQRLGR